MQKKLRARVVVPLDQRLADEYLSRSNRIQRTVVHAPLCIQGQPVERSALERGYARGLLLPVRFVQMPLDEMRADRLQPLAFAGGDAARLQPRALGQLRGHDPAPGLPAHAPAGTNPEQEAAVAQIT